MKRVFPILAVLVLIGLLTLLNKTMNKGAGDEDTPPPAPSPAIKQTTIPAVDLLLPEITVGNPLTARTKIVVGWVYDASTQANPVPLSMIIDNIRQRAIQSGGQISAEIVNLDTPQSELSPQAASVTGLGVAVNIEAKATADSRQIALAGNPGEGDVSVTIVNAALEALLTAKP